MFVERSREMMIDIHVFVTDMRSHSALIWSCEQVCLSLTASMSWIDQNPQDEKYMETGIFILKLVSSIEETKTRVLNHIHSLSCTEILPFFYQKISHTLLCAS